MGKRKAAKPERAVRADGKGDPLDQSLAEIWKTIAAGDVLHAEMQVSGVVSLLLNAQVTDERSEILVEALVDAAMEQNLDDAATRYLLSKLPEIFAEFPATYDDPVSVANRAYVRDIAASDTDAAWLDECRTRREFAAPLPASRDADAAAIDATTQGGRAALTEEEFAACAPEGAEGEKFIATVKGIVEELWHDDPPTTWQAGKRLMAQGLDEHDAIHRLAEIAGT